MTDREVTVAGISLRLPRRCPRDSWSYPLLDLRVTTRTLAYAASAVTGSRPAGGARQGSWASSPSLDPGCQGFWGKDANSERFSHKVGPRPLCVWSTLVSEVVHADPPQGPSQSYHTEIMGSVEPRRSGR
jgi:hypothetical protein